MESGSGKDSRRDRSEERRGAKPARQTMTAASFLTGILDEASNEAEAERKALEARLEGLRREKTQQEAREAEERRRHGEELLRQERERQKRVRERRTIEAQAIRLRIDGPTEDPIAAAKRPAPVLDASMAPQHSVEVRAAMRRGRRRLALAFALLVLAGGGVSAGLYLTAEPPCDPTSYAKVSTPLRYVMASVDTTTLLEVPDPVETPEIVEDTADAQSVASTSSRGRGRRDDSSSRRDARDGTRDSGSREPDRPVIQLDTNSGLFDRGGE